MPPLLPVPAATAAAVQAPLPKGNLSVELRAEFGTLYDDQLFADLYPPQGRPVEEVPWGVALVVVMPYIEGLTDRQAAGAVRCCMDWKYALSLDLTDPGFDFSLLHDFRCRVLTHEAGQRSLESLPSRLQRAGLGESAWHATDRFHACLSGHPHTPPVGMCPRSDALGAQPAQRRGSRLGAAAPAAGLEELHWRTRDEQPPSAVRIASPYDLGARYSSQRNTHGVGYTLHLTETCDPGQLDLGMT
jgi:transposase